MALYSLNHSHIGKTTQARPHTAAAHIKYITRNQDCTAVLAQHMPDGSVAARRWIREQEDADRKNARIIDKIMLALPLELTPAQNHALVREFAEQLTEGRACWFAAFHDKEKDAGNPHCHLVLRDRDHRTGKRVVLTSEKGSTDRFRMLWETTQNKHLEMHGHEARVDRRTLEAQGVEAEPQQHVGPVAPAMEKRGIRPVSRVRPRKSRFKGRYAGRDRVHYPLIDKGRTRQEFRREVITRRRPALVRDTTVDARRQSRVRRIITDPALKRPELAAIHDELKLEVSAMSSLSVADKLRREYEKSALLYQHVGNHQTTAQEQIAWLASRLYTHPEEIIAQVAGNAGPNALSADEVIASLDLKPQRLGRLVQNGVLTKMARPMRKHHRCLSAILANRIGHWKDLVDVRRQTYASAEAANKGLETPLDQPDRSAQLLEVAGARGKLAEQRFEQLCDERIRKREHILEDAPEIRDALDHERATHKNPVLAPARIRLSYRMALRAFDEPIENIRETRRKLEQEISTQRGRDRDQEQEY